MKHLNFMLLKDLIFQKELQDRHKKGMINVNFEFEYSSVDIDCWILDIYIIFMMFVLMVNHIKIFQRY